MHTISEYRVLKSAAGYYLGRQCFDPEMPEMGMNLPWERCTEYYPTASSCYPALFDYILSSCETEAEFDAVHHYIECLMNGGENPVADALAAFARGVREEALMHEQQRAEFEDRSLFDDCPF